MIHCLTKTDSLHTTSAMTVKQTSLLHIILANNVKLVNFDVIQPSATTLSELLIRQRQIMDDRLVLVRVITVCNVTKKRSKLYN